MNKNYLIILIFLVSLFTINYYMAFSDDGTASQNVDGCNELNTTNAIYTLTADVTNYKTCFNITANNITLNCAGHIINYSSNGTVGYGVYSNKNFTTIKNCVIKEGKSTGSGKYAVYFNKAEKGLINNNTIKTIGITGYGIYLYSGSNSNIISNNNISTSGSSAGYGIFFDNNNQNNFMNNTISNNIIKTTGASGRAIYFTLTANNNTIINNNITTTNDDGYGVYFTSSSSYNNVSNNNIMISGNDGRGIYTSTSVGNTFSNNVITSSGYGTSGYGIYLLLSSNSNTISNNIITTYNGDNSYGILLGSSSSSNTLSNNNITTNGTDGLGIILSTSSNDIVSNNIITTSGSGGHGFYLQSISNSNNFSNNILNLQGAGSCGIYIISNSLTNSSDNSFLNTNIKTNNTDGYSIFLYNTDNSFTIKDSILNSSYSGVQEFYINNTSNLTGGIWNFTNVTKSNGNPITINWIAGANGTLNMMWYLDVNVTNSTGSAIENANVTALDVSSILQFSLNTTATGFIPRQTLLEYTNINNTAITYLSNYTITTIKTSYSTDSQKVNLSINRQLNVVLTTDTTPPSIIIVSPANNTNSSNNRLNINYTTSDNIAVSSCWYSNDTYAVNTTLASCTNITNVTWSEGVHNVKIWVNDTSNNVNSSIVSFRIDTINPKISIVYPLSINYSTNISALNYTFSDTNLQSCWYSINNGSTNTSVACGTNLTGLVSNEGYNTWLVGVNDSSNNQNVSRVTFFKDTILPLISIISPTNNTNTSNSQLAINYTRSDTNLANCWYTKNAGVTNTTLANCINISGVTWAEGSNNIIIYVNDSVNNVNSSSVTFKLETLENITFCRDLNTANEIYNLTTSIITTGTCINILANNITLNCEGRSISGDGGLSDYGISSNGYNNFKLNNCKIANFGTNLYIENSDNFIIRDSNLTNTTQYGIYLVTSAGNNSVYNTSYDVNEEYVGGTSDLTRYWNYKVYVNDTAGNIVSGASVKIYNISNSLITTQTTDATGYITIQELITYKNNAGTRADYNNYTASALNTTTPPYVQTAVNSSFNLTAKTNFLNDFITLIYDATNPLISYGDGTEENYFNASRTWIYVNVTFTETNFKNITFTLKNDAGTVNSTAYTIATYIINWTGLSEGNYTYYVNITDLAENKNYTEIRNIRLDMTPPTIVIESPQESYTYSTNISLDLNYTVYDNYLAVSSCWFNLKNTTGTSYLIINRSLTNCANATFNVSQGSGEFILTIYSNDSVNNVNKTSVNFSISLEAPAINLVYPTNNLYLNSYTNVYFNYTSTDSNGVNTCEFYENWTSYWNLNDSNFHSDASPITGYFIKNISEGTYKWNVRCNDSLNQYAYASNNYTVNFDTTYPSVIINSPVNDSDITSLSLTITYNISDLNLDSCFFTLRNSSGSVHNYAENTSLVCSEAGSRTISTTDYGTYTFYSYGKDKAGNEKYAEVTFTSSAPSAPPEEGGGGGAPPEKKKAKETIPVIGILRTNETLGQYSDIIREILYTKINSLCSNKATGQFLAIQDYSQDCILSAVDLEIIRVEIEAMGFIVKAEDMEGFFEDYKDRLLFQGYETKETILKYNLFTSVLGIPNPIKITPPSLDRYFVISKPSGNITLEYIFKANKNIKYCEVVSDTPQMSCEILTNSSFKTVYYLNSTNFFSRIYSGQVAVTSDAEQQFLEVIPVNIAMRTLNLSYLIFGVIPAWLGIIISFVIVIILIILFRILRKKRKSKNL